MFIRMISTIFIGLSIFSAAVTSAQDKPMKLESAVQLLKPAEGDGQRPAGKLLKLQVKATESADVRGQVVRRMGRLLHRALVTSPRPAPKRGRPRATWPR